MSPFLVAAVAVTGVAAFFDLRTGMIPNWLTIGAMGLAPIAHLVWGVTHGFSNDDLLMTIGSAVLGMLACGFVPFLLYRQDAIGGGDVKLLLAVGGLLQTRWGFEAEMYSFFAAGLIAPAYLAYEGKLFRTLKNTLLLALNPLLPKSKRRKIEPTLLTWFRFAPAIFLGTSLAAYLHWSTR